MAVRAGDDRQAHGRCLGCRFGGNRSVSWGDFVAVWAEAERLSDELESRGTGDRYVAGVVTTCRWLATAIVPSIPGGVSSAYAPVSGRSAGAHEETDRARNACHDEGPASRRYRSTRRTRRF